jgi:hypothetical protein
MRTKITLALLFLNAALFAFIFYFEREWRQLERVQETRLRVLDASATDIRRLEIAGLAEPIVLERRGEDWFVAAPFEWPANPHAVKRILNELVFLEREASFTRAGSGSIRPNQMPSTGWPWCLSFRAKCFSPTKRCDTTSTSSLNTGGGKP